MNGDIFVERLEKAFNVKGNKELSERLGILETTISNWRRGHARPKIEFFLNQIVNAGLSAEWVLNGRGPMMSKDLRNIGDAGEDGEEILRAEAKKVQLLIDRGMVRLPNAGIVAIQPGVGGEGTVDIPHFQHRVAAGFPVDSTSSSEILSLPASMVKHPADTYAVTVTGDSMLGVGIYPGDILVVDRSSEATTRSIVIASINGAQTVKRLWINRDGSVVLRPANHDYDDITVKPEDAFEVQGVVTWLLRKKP